MFNSRIRLFSNNQFVINNVSPLENTVRDKITKISPMLKNYAKANDVNVEFRYDPSSSDTTEHLLNIVVSNGCVKRQNSCSPNTQAIFVHKPNKNFSYEENFERRVFRLVSELTQNVQKQIVQDKNDYMTTVHTLRQINF